MTDSNSKNSNTPGSRENNQVRQLPFWIALGAGIGTAFGVALGNIAVGTALGTGIGVAIGAALEQKNKNKKS